jgi:lipopolysaccharide transport system ATP-binding protein
MEDNILLIVEDISKRYRLGEFNHLSFFKDLWSRLNTSENRLKYSKHNNTSINNRENVITDEYVWSLNEINFTLRKGDVVGLIGRNGAGKSTLLKILSRITSPTQGNVKIAGKIASLLEVGTGFHPELTGRENVYLNGAILGLSTNEVREKFEEIIDFSGCRAYIDTPTKRYSSGMVVRLGFAVAAFLDPDILIVDEVLAVGDIEFQKRAIEKIQSIVKTKEKACLFVSHNMRSIASLCNRVIVLDKARVVFDGNVSQGIGVYEGHFNMDYRLDFNQNEEKYIKIEKIGNMEIFRINNARILQNQTSISNSRAFYILNSEGGTRIEFEIDVFRQLERFMFVITFWRDDKMLLSINSFDNQGFIKIDNLGKHQFVVSFLDTLLGSGKYIVNLEVIESKKFHLKYLGVFVFESYYKVTNDSYHETSLRPSFNLQSTKIY